MPTISEFFGIIISIYYSDHAPPHFHARYGEFEALVQISPIALLIQLVPYLSSGLSARKIYFAFLVGKVHYTFPSLQILYLFRSLTPKKEIGDKLNY